MTSNASPDKGTMEERFDGTFELTSEGCSECGGFELIDKREIPYPKGKYHCEYDLDKIKSFIRSEVEAARREERDKCMEIVANHVLEDDTNDEYVRGRRDCALDIFDHLKAMAEEK